MSFATIKEWEDAVEAETKRELARLDSRSWCNRPDRVRMIVRNRMMWQLPVDDAEEGRSGVE